MDGDESHESRRRILRIAGSGSIVAVAGCLGGGEVPEAGDQQSADWCFEELSDEPPEVEQDASSIDGIERKDEEDLMSKEDAGYHCGPVDGEHCGNCTFYIDDRDGDAIGACTEVEGQIRSVDWCGLWAAREKMGTPED